MRIGELAALVGVSTRTVRHYHHLGLLPEPVRLANGYREYQLRDAVALARIRRLAELGLSLDELRDALAEDAGKDLREMLLELDADLAREQEALAARRERLAALLAETDPEPGMLLTPDLAATLHDLAAGGSQVAEVDHQLLTLVGTMADPADQAWILDLMRPLTEPGALARGNDLYQRLDELADADPGDPRVAELARDLADHLPAEMASMMVAAYGVDDRWLSALFAEISAAQAEVFRLILVTLKGRA